MHRGLKPRKGALCRLRLCLMARQDEMLARVREWCERATADRAEDREAAASSLGRINAQERLPAPEMVWLEGPHAAQRWFVSLFEEEDALHSSDSDLVCSQGLPTARVGRGGTKLRVPCSGLLMRHASGHQLDRLRRAVGDVHGHLQLALCVAARWQRELGVSFDAVFLCGDVGAFTAEDQLDSATRSHARSNPCELEFLRQWAADPPPEWLERIFQPFDAGGLGLSCPVAMVHGNHEGFEHLEQRVPDAPPEALPKMEDLPAVDTAGHLRYLPSGWRCLTPGGLRVAGIGGVEPNQRRAAYHSMACQIDPFLGR